MAVRDSLSQAYRLLAEEMYAKGWDYPLHLGVTEAGALPRLFGVHGFVLWRAHWGAAAFLLWRILHILRFLSGRLAGWQTVGRSAGPERWLSTHGPGWVQARARTGA